MIVIARSLAEARRRSNLMKDEIATPSPLNTLPAAGRYAVQGSGLAMTRGSVKMLNAFVLVPAQLQDGRKL
jgi:hypothetical protein